MKRPERPQGDLFGPPPVKPRNFDERRLVDTLRNAPRKWSGGKVNGMSPEQFRRYFPFKMPRVTVSE